MNTDLIHYFISCVVKESSALAEFITAQSDMRTAILTGIGFYCRKHMKRQHVVQRP